MIKRNGVGFFSCLCIGILGGLIGLGGAEFRLPLLVGVFRIQTLEAIIFNKAMSLLVVCAALLFRSSTISVSSLADNLGIVLNLLAGSLIGAWWAAGHAITMSRQHLNRVVLVLLIALAILMLWEAWHAVDGATIPLFEAGWLRLVVGVIAGLAIGMVAAFLGVAGGELLIPTIVLLYGADIKLAGSLSLMVSLPTMVVSFARYSGSDAFTIIKKELPLMRWMIAGSVLGAAIGALMLDAVSTKLLMALLGIVLLISAIKTFKHS